MLASLLNGGSLSLAVISLLASTAAADVFESLPGIPDGWRYSRTPSANQPIKLNFGLTQEGLHEFENALLDMSTPGHRDYGKHFQSHDEMKRMLQPSDDSLHSVQNWLESAGVKDVQRDADWLTVHTTVEKANDLLHANFQYYVNRHKHVERLRTLEYSLPKAVVPHVNVVSPTTRFGQLKPNRATIHSKAKAADEAFRQAALSPSASCDTAITPECLKSIYNVGDYKPQNDNGNKVAFASYLEQYARYEDLALFEKNLAPYANGDNFTVIEFHGGGNDQNSQTDSSEANLDLQTIVGLSSPVPVTEFSTGGRGSLVPDLDQPDINNNNNEPYLDFLQNVVKMSNDELPQVISTSYGEDEQSVPEKYARSVCNLYAQLGSRGVSIIFSSGDSGFPAACPWVTSVGATTHTSPEKAVYFSSGGFSDLWERPKYQEDAVDSYLQNLGNQWSGLFNAKGRAFPDVSAQGQNYAIYEKGQLTRVDGTSASAPAFAGIIALLNDARIQAGQSTMGFLNPWLYSDASSVLNDITNGGSTGCDGNGRFGGPQNGGPTVPYASWNATKGWDPVTGLGTPNFANMVKNAVKSSN
ncbi:hypothetical protein N7509_012834 [Penicillium cosmopolitanum]|uniref:tripeptidyl-peptidase II n=1 Tax=Penicillium cosmopolitanum TaxID=1131564 RepID=A0A9W9SC66_9EURO|nr:uncharacterized protein N7509_012834 [Penicillium cosmopolitanum]KAJ5375948.1 hypothetical protein N7509_012834 [Penicillium cosmopolitanum]